MFPPDDYLTSRGVFYSRLVIPAQAGIQKCFFVLDPRMRGDEDWMPAVACPCAGRGGHAGKTPRPLDYLPGLFLKVSTRSEKSLVQVGQ
jgi:hypothetical protein